MKMAFAGPIMLFLISCVSVSNASFEIINKYSVKVDYSKSLETSIEACKFKSIDSNITRKNFPTIEMKNRDFEIILVRFGTFVVPENVIKELSSMGYRQATIKELLAFGETYQDLDVDGAIIASGSTCRLMVVRTYSEYVNSLPKIETTFETFYAYILQKNNSRELHLTKSWDSNDLALFVAK
jgi:hypothetical protein